MVIGVVITILVWVSVRESVVYSFINKLCGFWSTRTPGDNEVLWTCNNDEKEEKIQLDSKNVEK